MSLKDNLQKDEKIITYGKVHWACLIPHILLALFFIGFITIWPSLIRLFTTEFVVTNKRIYGKVGMINTKTLDTPINKVDSITVTNGLFGKILGYGDLHITSPAGEYILKGIKSPEMIRNAIMKQIDAFDKAKARNQAEEIARAMGTSRQFYA